MAENKYIILIGLVRGPPKVRSPGALPARGPRRGFKDAAAESSGEDNFQLSLVLI